MSNKFDVIVVGAGLAGSACAIEAARAGLKVLVIERGEYVGAKNTSGGMIYAQVLEELVPDFWKDAPLERPIGRQRVMMTSGKREMTLEIGNGGFLEPPYNGFSVLRGKFDPWLAKRAQEAGALIVTSTVVDGLIKRDGRVIGVKTRRPDGDCFADVVVLADGANSLLARKMAMRKPYGHHDMYVGVKELIRLPEGAIEERFGVSQGEGVSYAVIGDFARGIPGGGFLYTNKDSVSLGMVMQPDALASQQITADEVLARYKEVPEIARLIAGGKLVEYSGHLVGESGLKGMSQLYGDGVLVAGDAAGFVVNTGIVLMGMNLAISSGICAGKACAGAISEGDVSAKSLSRYEEICGQCAALSAMRAHGKAPEFMSSPRLYDEYPGIINGILEEMVTIGPGTAKGILNIAKEHAKGIKMTSIARDVWKGAKSL